MTSSRKLLIESDEQAVERKGLLFRRKQQMNVTVLSGSQ